MSGNKKYSLEMLIEISKKLNPNIEILGEYNKIVGKNKPRNERRIKCKCRIDGYEFEKSVNELITGVGCRKCADKVNGDRTRLDVNYIKEQLREVNPMVEILSTEYINARTPLKCRCLIHDYIFESRWDDLRKGKGCKFCKGDKLSRENNPMWKASKTEEERISQRKTLKDSNWVKSIFERDNYTCQCCGKRGGNENAHHLDGYNWCIDKRYNIDNGVLLCEDCHKYFHHLFGYGDNTKEQYEEFLQLNINNHKAS